MQMKKSQIPLLLLTAAIAISLVAGGVLISQLHVPAKGTDSGSASASAGILDALVATEMILTETALQTPSPAQPPEMTPTALPAAAAIDPFTYFRSQTDPDRFIAWIRALSGADPILVNGVETKIETRYSYAMFTGQANAPAEPYLLEQIRQWIPENQLAVEEYPYADATSSYTWKNIVVTFPGTVHPEEQVLFTAHFDSIVVFEGDPLTYSPGANDNGTGLATILEAIRIFKDLKFEKTVKIVLFSGEENFQEGSKAYVAAHAGDNIIAMVNMDMYGTDKDNDRCFELYVGSLPGSLQLSELFMQTVSEFSLNLKADQLIDNAYAKADQKPFWDAGIPAVTAMENFLTDYTPGGCETGMDRTDCWHLPCDTHEKINVPYAFDIGLAGTYTVMKLAVAQPVIP